MERHHREQAAAAAQGEARRQAEKNTLDKKHGLIILPRRSLSSSSSSSSSDDSVSGDKRRFQGSDSSSDDGIEILPDRFDRNGRRIDSQSTSQGRWTSRSGNFERLPQHRGDLSFRGAWQVASTDGDMVERFVRDMTGALEGRKSWLSVLGNVIGGIVAPERREAIKDRNRSNDGFDDDEQRHRRNRRQRR